jgi:hypothetical protein
LNGEANRVSKRQNRAIIAADVRRFGHVIIRTEFSVHTTVRYLGIEVDDAPAIAEQVDV